MARTVFRHPLAAVVTVTMIGGVAQAAAARPARYVVAGTVSAVDGATLTLAPATGPDPKPRLVTVTVADGATVMRNDAAATLADLVAGDRVTASGTRTGTAVTVTAVVATAPGAQAPAA